MNILYVLTAGLAGYFIGYKMSSKQLIKKLDFLKNYYKSDIVFNKRNYLGAIRREIANELTKRDKRRFKNNYLYLLDERKKIEKLTRDEVETRLAALRQSYKLMNDFDVIGTRDYISYSYAFETESDDDLLRLYNDIVFYCLLNAELDSDWDSLDFISEREFEHLKNYIDQKEA